jgi:hypothetical protein
LYFIGDPPDVFVLKASMTKKQTFTGVIDSADGGGAYVRIPFDVQKEAGSKRPRIKATIETEVYRGSLVRIGTPFHVLGIRKEIRDKIGKDVGSQVTITVEEDLEPRVVEIPPQLENAFKKDKEARVYFNSLSYTHRREYVNFISEAKRDATRADRTLQTIVMLKKMSKEQ